MATSHDYYNANGHGVFFFTIVIYTPVHQAVECI